MLKKIDVLVLKSAFGSFLVTLFIGNLVFLMQFLYRRIDEIIGKGIGWDVIGELIMYASFSLVPYSLPLAVLIASIMTMGNLGERYELVAMKASGISLFRAMRSLIIAAFIMSGIAFYFSNNVMPYSLLKMSALRWDIKNKKPTMLLEEGVFFSDFDQMTMKVEEMGNNDLLYDITIYDHRKVGETKVIKADSAYIESSDTTSYMIIHLMDGKLHEDGNSKNKYTRFGFKNFDLVVDMSSFEMGETDEDLFKDNAKLKNVQQISHDRDSIENRLQQSIDDRLVNMESSFLFLDYQSEMIDSLQAKSPNTINNIFKKNTELEQTISAISRAKTTKQKLVGAENRIEPIRKNLIDHEVAWYQKFALAFSCVVLFFIGAPMGALVRKGGFGMPIVIAIVFYLIYYIINISGRRLAEDGIVNPMIGIWLSTIVLFPIAILLTRMAILDMKINIGNAIVQPIQDLFKQLFAKK